MSDELSKPKITQNYSKLIPSKVGEIHVDYEKSAIDTFRCNVRLRVRIACVRIYGCAYWRDTPQRTHRLRRDTHLRRLTHRHRLPLSVSRVIIYLLLAASCSRNLINPIIHRLSFLLPPLRSLLLQHQQLRYRLILSNVAVHIASGRRYLLLFV